MNEMTVREFVERYLLEARTFYKSFSSLASVMNSFAAAYGDFRLVMLRPPDIHGYVHLRLTHGLKASTINQELALLRSAINYVRHHWGVMMDNPVVRHRLKASANRLRYLSKAEARALLAAVAGKQHLAAFIQLGLYTGCRKTELLTIRWSDIDFQRGFLVLRPENTKANRSRCIPLNRHAIQALEQLRQGNESEWVFVKPNGQRRMTIDWGFRKSLKLAGIEDFRVHDLRHTFASWLVSEGVALIKVRDLLGHTSIKMTERYAHLAPDRLREAVEVLDRQYSLAF